MDYVYCYLSYYGYKAGQATMTGFWDEMAKLGKDRNPYRAGFLQFVGVAETREKALELYAEPAEYFYGRCLHIDPRFAGPPGYATEETQRRGIKGMVSQAADASRDTQRYETKFQTLAREMDAIVDKGYVIIGSPDEVVEQLTRSRDQPQCRPPDDALAVRQHEQGAGQVQHPALRREGHAAAAARAFGLGRQMVAAADAKGRARGAGRLLCPWRKRRRSEAVKSPHPNLPPLAGEGARPSPCNPLPRKRGRVGVGATNA